MGWTVQESNHGAVRFSAHPDRPCGPPSLPYNGYQVFPGGVLLTTHPLLVPRSWKGRAIFLPTHWATTGPVTGTLYLFFFTRVCVSVCVCVCVFVSLCAKHYSPKFGSFSLFKIR